MNTSFSLSYAHVLVIISVLMSLIGAAAYIRDTFSGKTKPNLVSWSMWALAPLIGTGAALFAHADPWATVRIFLAGFIPLLVVIVSFANKQSYWKLTLFDGICGVLSILALVVWFVVDSPEMAILLAAAGDGFAALPTIVKAWKNPETETGTTFIMSFIGALIVLPSIPVWNIENSAFQVYLLAVNILLVIAVYRKAVLSRLISVFYKR